MTREFLKGVKRIVIKIGTNTIMKDQQIDFAKMDRLAFVCATLQQRGLEVVIVSSGSIGVGAAHLCRSTYPTTIAEQQAASAVGQNILMGHYNRFFSHYGVNVAQILLTRDVIDFPQSLQNVTVTINTLLADGIIPILNENDAIAVDELDHQTKFGDNDTLSAIVALIVKSDLLVILSDVEGLYTDNPTTNPDAQLLSHIQEIDENVLEMANGKGSEFSTGGMATKLSAAQIILEAGTSMVIASGEDPTIIFKVLKAKTIGTLFSK